MNVRCYTIQCGTVYTGINGSVLNIDKEGPVFTAKISAINDQPSDNKSDLRHNPWETAYTFTDCCDGAITRGGLIHLSLMEWIPCPHLGDSSILLESFSDGSGLLYMPKMSCILRGVANDLFLVSGNSGKPEIGIAGPTGVLRRTKYKGIEQTPKPPPTTISPEISALVDSLRTYRDTSEPLPLPQDQVSTSPPHILE